MIDYDIELPTSGSKQGSTKRQRSQSTAKPIPMALHILTQIVWPLDDTPSIEVQSIDRSSSTKSYR